MTKFDIFSDCHMFGPAQVKANLKFGPNTIHLDDNIDLKSIPRKIAPDAIACYLQYVNRLIHTGSYFVRGNHSVKYGSICPDYAIIENRILAHHGDILWPKEKRDKWHNREAGQGFLAMAASRSIANGRHIIKKTKLSNKQLEILHAHASEIEQKELTAIDISLFGHTHPSKMIDVFYKGRRYINVMQGHTQLEL